MTRRHANTPLVVGVYGVGALDEVTVENLFGDLVEKVEGNLSFVFHLTDSTLTDTIQAVLDFVSDPQQFEDIDHFDYDAVTDAESKKVPTISKLVGAAVDTKVVHNTEKAFLDILEQAPKSMLALFLAEDDDATVAMAEAAAGRDIDVVDAMHAFERIEFEEAEEEIPGEDNAAVEEPVEDDDEELSDDEVEEILGEDTEPETDEEAASRMPTEVPLSSQDAAKILAVAQQQERLAEEVTASVTRLKRALDESLLDLTVSLAAFLAGPDAGDPEPVMEQQSGNGTEPTETAPERPSKRRASRRAPSKPKAEHVAGTPVKGRPPQNVKRDAHGKARRNDDGSWMLKKGAA